jgi:hypothetical protein
VCTDACVRSENRFSRLLRAETCLGHGSTRMAACNARQRYSCWDSASVLSRLSIALLQQVVEAGRWRPQCGEQQRHAPHPSHLPAGCGRCLSHLDTGKRANPSTCSRAQLGRKPSTRAQLGLQSFDSRGSWQLQAEPWACAAGQRCMLDYDGDDGGLSTACVSTRSPAPDLILICDFQLQGRSALVNTREQRGQQGSVPCLAVYCHC